MTDSSKIYSDETLLRRQVFNVIYENPNIDDGVNLAIKSVGEYFGVSRVYVFENSNDNLFGTNTYE